MNKDFDTWNNIKKKIHNSSEEKYFHEREVWWCTLGVNVGYEQDGSEKDFRRPILIVKAFSKDTCLVLPLTTSKKDHHLRIAVGKIDGELAKGLVSQIKVVDKKRLVRKIERINKEVFKDIKKTIKELL